MSSLVNALLVRHSQGFVWVEDTGSEAAYWRSEKFLQLSGAKSADEASRVADALLVGLASPRVEIVAGIETSSGDEPYTNFNVGDTITVPDMSGAPVGERVVGLSVSEDDDGNITWVPQLGSPVDQYEQRIDRVVQRMNSGSLSGLSESIVAAAVPSQSAQLGLTVPGTKFIYRSSLAVGVGPLRWEPTTPKRVVLYKATLDTVGSTATVVALVLNGVRQSPTLTIPSGQHSAFVACSIFVNGPAHDYLQGEIVTVGTGAKDLAIEAVTG